MGRRLMARLAAGVAALLAAGAAHGQPEYVAWETLSDPSYPALFDVEGDLLAWTSRPWWPSDGLVTSIYRRHGSGWTLEAEMPGVRGQDLGFTVIEGRRIATTTYGFGGTRMYRHDRQGWNSEPVRGLSNLFETGTEIIDVSGEWLVAARQWPHEEGLAFVYRFDGAGWRLHALLEDPELPDHVGGWVQVEGDLLALGAMRTDPFAPTTLVIFTLVDGAWELEARLPEADHPLDIDNGRVLASDRGRLAIYEQRAPGEWAQTARFPPTIGLADLDGDKLVALERYEGPGPYDNSCRAVLYEQIGADWVPSRFLYPSTAFGYGSSQWSVGFSEWSQPKYADGEIFVRSHDYLLAGAREYILGFPACRADFNGDGVADIADLYAFLEGQEQYMLSTDYNMNDQVGPWEQGDLLEFMRLLEEGC